MNEKFYTKNLLTKFQLILDLGISRHDESSAFSLFLEIFREKFGRAVGQRVHLGFLNFRSAPLHNGLLSRLCYPKL